MLTTTYAEIRINIIKQMYFYDNLLRAVAVIQT